MVAYSASLNETLLMGYVEDQSTQCPEVMSRLIGARLTSVQFVMDYVILGFDKKGALTTLVWPELRRGDNVLTSGMSGYRDCLCALISHVVSSAAIDQEETITIVFDELSQIIIPLRSYKLQGERAILTGPKHFLYVW